MKPLSRFLLTVALFAVAGPVLADQPPLIYQGDVTTSNNVVEELGDAWQAAGHPPMDLTSVNTVSGIEAVARGSADVAGSARARAPQRELEANLTFTPVVWDALTIITNPRNPVDNLSLKQLHDIYYGEITNWQQVGGKDKKIHVYAVAAPSDGVEFSLRRLLFGRGNQPVAAPRLYMNSTQLAHAVALDPQSLGVSTLSNVHDNSDLKMLDVEHVSPSASNVADGSYTLYTPLYLVTRNTNSSAPAESTSSAGSAGAADAEDSARDDEVRQLISFLQGDKAARILRQHELIPYAAAEDLAARDADHLQDIAQTIANEPRTPIRTGNNDTSVAASTQSASHYTVESGDTLSKIANAESVTVEQLRQWNDIDGNMIHPGQELVIHPG